MKEQLVSFETAKLAKEKGFNWNCEKCFQIGNLKIVPIKNHQWKCLDPTQSLLQKWLREIHGIDICIHRSFSMTKSYHYCIIKDCNYENETSQTCIPGRTYEQALEDGLYKTLNLIK